jgi:hypothetical protein
VLHSGCAQTISQSAGQDAAVSVGAQTPSPQTAMPDPVELDVVEVVELEVVEVVDGGEPPVETPPDPGKPPTLPPPPPTPPWPGPAPNRSSVLGSHATTADNRIREQGKDQRARAVVASTGARIAKLMGLVS